jgi:hypothetical protein
MERSDGSERELDRRLREALAPRPESVERVVRGALASQRPEKLRLAPALTVLAVLAVTAGLLVLAPHPPPRTAAPEAKISIESVGDLLVVHHREGGRWSIRSSSSGPAEGSLPSRSLIVIYGGKP